MGFWSFIGNALNSTTADVPHSRGVVTTGMSSTSGDWGIYCGSHRILTVTKMSWGDHGAGEIVIIPDTVFIELAHTRHYYHFIDSEYRRYCISEAKARDVMQRIGDYYGTLSAEFIAELCGLKHPSEIEKAGFQRRAVFPEKF